MSFENYIVTSKCFISQKTLDRESLVRLDDVMRDRGYVFESGDPLDLLLSQASLNMRIGTRINHHRLTVECNDVNTGCEIFDL